MNRTALYQLDDVHFSYPGQPEALTGINLSIKQHSRIAIVGENGSGKSTLLKLLDGLYVPNSGRISFESQELSEKLLDDEKFAFEFRRRVALLFQDPETQLFSATVYEEICFGPLQLKWDQEKIRESARAMMSCFGIEELADRPPYRLSVGEKKKVALASILAVDPEVLLLDEPVAALDPRTQNLLLELIHSWSRNGKTVITSTHDLTILKEIADEVNVMEKGRIVHHSSVDDLLKDEELLQRYNLIHVHSHKHQNVEHAHPHSHDFHGHTHEE
jgi:cobalt/nickel transport system ATP-binding protein